MDQTQLPLNCKIGAPVYPGVDIGRNSERSGKIAHGRDIETKLTIYPSVCKAKSGNWSGVDCLKLLGA